MDKFNIQFMGAAKTVTGSCYLFESNGKKYLIDCGMFQGPDVEKYNSDFKFDPSDISAVFLTHAHIDHSGRIPMLYKGGFEGYVYATAQTHELSTILLYDSAKIQENREKYHHRTNDKKDTQKLYDTNNVDQYVSRTRTFKMGEWYSVDDLKIKYVRAGHILGAVSIIIEINGKRIMFSGDIGRKEQSLILPYEYISEDVDYIVMESLYGGVEHDKRSHSINELLKVIKNVTKRDGNVMVPSFSIHRSQELVAYLYSALKMGKISQNVQIILDGPLAISATDIYTKYLRKYDESIASDLEYVYSGNEIKNMFSMSRLLVVRNSFVSRRTDRKHKAVFIAGNGMLQGGRILGHISKGIQDKKNAIVFVGYQAEATLGRQVVEGAKFIKLNNKSLAVNAKVYNLKGFSAHADQSDLMDWFKNKKSKRLRKVFLVHSDIDRSTAFKRSILADQSDRFEVVIPDLFSSFKL